MKQLKAHCSWLLRMVADVRHEDKSVMFTLHRELQYFKRKRLPSMYDAFNNIVALGQFVTLGLVLLAHLARISTISDQIMTLIVETGKLEKKPSISNKAPLLGNDDLLDIHDATEFKHNSTRNKITAKKIKKKRKAKGKKSAIDDIFG